MEHLNHSQGHNAMSCRINPYMGSMIWQEPAVLSRAAFYHNLRSCQDRIVPTN
ncbi:hypothetical protein THIOM_004219 [Candidatus Thiomargarita nelsonii]|uniref:Uncharacterized protein n=1 Tax=Candidatus Thiomargarita nelsonii TaxID=1003181 RepID=A0A176RWI9_9GAMM|nr:hypothetical protein THIOM_004219 [Candidatus Thiomargarita nelsonii]